MLQTIHDNFPGSCEATVPISTENWQLITDAMSNVTSSPIGTAYVAHLEGVDFAGKTGTAQVMGHDALARSGGGHKTVPNAWFVGMAPRRNPDIVVAVLWENGNWGNDSAKLGAQVIDAFVEKLRKRENNIRIVETPKPATPAATTASVETAARPATAPSIPQPKPVQPN